MLSKSSGRVADSESVCGIGCEVGSLPRSRDIAIAIESDGPVVKIIVYWGGSDCGRAIGRTIGHCPVEFGVAVVCNTAGIWPKCRVHHMISKGSVLGAIGGIGVGDVYATVGPGPDGGRLGEFDLHILRAACGDGAGGVAEFAPCSPAGDGAGPVQRAVAGVLDDKGLARGSRGLVLDAIVGEGAVNGYGRGRPIEIIVDISWP